MPTRRLALAHVMNMRDLGGYDIQNGKATFFGRLIRSDAPCGLEKEEVMFLIDFGVRTVLDMRSAVEVEKRPCSLKGITCITYHHYPFAVGNRLPKSQEEVPLIYWEMVADYSAMKNIMRTIAYAKTAVVFCCTAGKDRTGVVAAVLLLLAGVSRNDILADYQVSYTYIRKQIMDLRKREPGLPPFTGRSNIEYMDSLLDHFESVFGTAQHYLNTIGLSQEEIELLRDKLIK